jgi:HlyD family type I secretion membrane fusion protein
MTGALTRLKALAVRETNHEREFLPAALEITESPPSPTLRITAGFICLFLLIGLIWAIVSRVDLIATAPGKIVAAGSTKNVQAFETGLVREIKVHNGDLVAKGQVLILLDPTLAGADRTRYQQLLRSATLDQARLEGLLGQGKGDPFAGVDAPPEMIQAARDQMISERQAQDAKLLSQEREVTAKKADRASIAAELAKDDGELPLARERAKIREGGVNTGFGSKLDYINAEQQRVELENERAVQVQKLASADAAIQAAIAERDRTAAEFVRDRREDLSKAAREVAEARGELAKAQQRTDLTSITAPVDGYVQDLAVHTVGGVVQPGQQLLRVVPSDSAVEVEAIVENADAGFVRVGQEAELKIATFPFTHYGLVHGRVVSIAHDSAPDPETQNQLPGRDSSAGSGDAPSEVRRSNGLVYVARIAMNDPTIDVDGVRTPLEPGMAVTAEIKTGRRRVIDYILSPIAQHSHDALRER